MSNDTENAEVIAEEPAPAAEAPPPGHYRTLARNVLTNWIWYTLVLASGLIVPRLIGQHQGKEMLGVWDLGWSLGYYVSLCSLGLTSSVTRYVAHYRVLRDWDNLNKTANTGLVLLSAGSLVGILCAFGFAALTPWLVPDARPETIHAAYLMILLLSIGDAMHLPGTILSGIITGYERYDLLNLIRGLFDGLVLVAMITLLVLGYSLVSLAIAFALAEVPAFITRLWVARRLSPQLRISFAYFRWSTAREMVVFSGKSILQWLANSALYQLNGILVSFFMGPVVLAVYSRQRVLVLQSVRFIRQYAAVFAPSSSALHAAGDVAALQRLMSNTSRYGMYFTLPIMLLLMIMGRPLVDLWMKPGYAAPLILTIMALGHLLSVPQQGVYMILLGMGRHGLPAVFDAIGAVVSVILAVVLMGLVHAGMVGGALAMAIPVALMGGIVLPVYACRTVGLGFGRYLRGTALGPLLMNIPFALCLVTARLILPGQALRAMMLGAGVGGILTLIIYWKWALPQEIRKKVLERLGVRRKQRAAPQQESCPPAVSAIGPTNPARSAARPRICFVAPTAYAPLSGREDVPFIGGSQIQQVLIARELARRGYAVSFIVHDHGQPDGIEHEGIRAYKMCGFSQGLPLLRFIHPQWTSLWRALTRADPDVVYQRGAGCETGQVSMWCRHHGRRLVFAAASNSDCDPRLPYLPTWRERVLYRYGLRRADRVIAQTHDQVEAFCQSFGIEASLIRSCSQDPGPAGTRGPVTNGRPSVLWVGRFSYEKRPELLLEVAGRCPEIQFDIVGAANASQTPDGEIARRAARLKNVTLHGRVPHEKMADFYTHASVLLLTSMWEGFPNTFMEAWARGVPTISTVDPDDVISANKLGGIGHSVDDLASAINRLTRSGDCWRECSANARRFFENHHSVAAAVDAYESLLGGIA